jgi:rifampin ADP-ribosylating transferase
MAAMNGTTPRTFYHGARADLHPGDLIAPGYSSNYGRRKQAAWVDLTGTLDAAVWGAELAAGDGPGRIYVVEESLWEPDSRLRRSGSTGRSRTIPI